jgi:hypothetical protein
MHFQVFSIHDPSRIPNQTRIIGFGLERMHNIAAVRADNILMGLYESARRKPGYLELGIK